ncbi:MAG TPA: type VI secretion system-associated FHA domain protein TagH [Steroidobacteraceae bacterium]|jgi:type VI secretion system protein
MALKLTIVEAQNGQADRGNSIVFGVAGGGIGRAHDNDWVLPDPQRYLSAHHARVQFRDGAYYLQDTSTNGVYVNDGTVPIGRRNPYPLRDGDRLRLGEYRLLVSIDTERSEAPEASGVFPVNADALASNSMVSRGDIGVELNVRDLLHPGAAPANDLGAVDAFGQPPLAATEDTGLLAFDSGKRAAPANLSAPAERRREPRIPDRSVDNAAGIDAFCRGAGIDVKQLPVDAAGRLLQLAGVLLREALLGIKGMALAQREIRDQTHVEVGKEDPQHIGLTGLPVDDLLLRLMVGHDRRDLDAVQWVRDMLGSTRRHDLAMVRALHTALGEFLARLDPRALAQVDARAGGAAANGEAAGLAARFRSITEMPAGKLPHLFAEAFARAFVVAFRQNNGDHARS